MEIITTQINIKKTFSFKAAPNGVWIDENSNVYIIKNGLYTCPSWWIPGSIAEHLYFRVQDVPGDLTITPFNGTIEIKDNNG